MGKKQVCNPLGGTRLEYSHVLNNPQTGTIQAYHNATCKLTATHHTSRAKAISSRRDIQSLPIDLAMKNMFKFIQRHACSNYDPTTNDDPAHQFLFATKALGHL